MTVVDRKGRARVILDVPGLGNADGVNISLKNSEGKELIVLRGYDSGAM